MSPRAVGSSAMPGRSAPRSVDGFARPLNLAPRSESHPISCSPRSPLTLPSPTACSASGRRIYTTCSILCPFNGCSESDGNRCRPCRRPVSKPSEMPPARASRLCGAPSASTATPCGRWRAASTSVRWSPIATRNPSARRRHSHRIFATRASSNGVWWRSPTALPPVCALMVSRPARVSVKIRRADFKTYTRQCVLGRPTQDTAVVSGAARRLLAAWLVGQPNAALRLLGVGTGDLCALRQADLFATGPARDSRLDAAVDGIRGRFGPAVLTRASLLPRGPRVGPRRG